MKKIIVAGAGHGGLSAAITLAKAGYDVTVIEKQKRRDMGHDWCDAVYLPAFDQTDIDTPEDSAFTKFQPMCYKNPSKTVTLVSKPRTDNKIRNIDRKYLIEYLITSAEKAGAEYIFETEISGAFTQGSSVKGVKLKNGETLVADLVIDAAGMDSPVRRSLPKDCNIQNDFTDDDLFNVYRAYFRKTEEKFTDPPYTLTFCHCWRVGMDWAITEDGYIDILIGNFGKLTQGDIDTALADYRKDYPYMSDELLRGGSVARIPVRKALPMFVCDGYAAVGDSAAMVEPLSGSGICASIKAGKMLADTVISAGDAAIDKKILWKYEYDYFNKLGNKQLNPEVIKNMLKTLKAKNMDYFMRSGIIGVKEMSGKAGGYSFGEIMQKAGVVIKKPSVISPLLKMLMKMNSIKKVKALLPEEYDEEKISRWMKAYNKL
ncbi:MAG: NAD(P)/FAD-dependent oxidoreductase [Clostridiales bacterium]|nr:NAD(P)/FAD-dependent oxidoreductase [Clostridiales bacterium]